MIYLVKNVFKTVKANWNIDFLVYSHFRWNMFCFVNQVPETNSANLLSAQKHTRHCLPNWSFLWKFSLINQQYYRPGIFPSFLSGILSIHPSLSLSWRIVSKGNGHACLPCVISKTRQHQWRPVSLHYSAFAAHTHTTLFPWFIHLFLLFFVNVLVLP